MNLFSVLALCATLSAYSLFTDASPLPGDDFVTELASPILPRTRYKHVSKVNGSLFDIGGTTQYFAGSSLILFLVENIRSLTIARSQRLVARSSTSKFRCQSCNV